MLANFTPTTIGIACYDGADPPKFNAVPNP